MRTQSSHTNSYVVALAAAKGFAKDYGNEQAGVTCLALGILVCKNDGSAIADRLVKKSGRTRQDLLKAVYSIASKGKPRSETPQFSKNAQRAMRFAHAERKSLDQALPVGCSHLLLGTIEHGEPRLVETFQVFGITIESVTAAILRLNTSEP